MMTTLALTTIEFSSGNGSALAEFFGFVARSLGFGSTATAPKVPGVDHLAADAETRIGQQLLHVADADEFDDRLDEILRDGVLYHLNALMWRDVDLAALQSIHFADFESRLQAQLQPLRQSERDRLTPLLLIWARALLGALQHVLAHNDLAVVSQAVQQLRPDMLFSPEIPPEIAACIADQMRVMACLLAVVAAVRSQKPLSAWLSAVLADRLSSALRGHLRLLSTLDGADVPAAVLPESERLDLAEIEARHRLARQRVAALVQDLP